MLLGVIANDFTGASDVANTLAKGIADREGLKTVQFLGIPSERAPSNCEAGVISLKSRFIPAREAVTPALAALAWLRGEGRRQFFFKYCSTFDWTLKAPSDRSEEALAGPWSTAPR
jgi:uncharacterized protein YgbK (DUF1537 family)